MSSGGAGLRSRREKKSSQGASRSNQTGGKTPRLYSFFLFGWKNMFLLNEKQTGALELLEVYQLLKAAFMLPIALKCRLFEDLI